MVIEWWGLSCVLRSMFVSVALFHFILFAAAWARQKLCELVLLFMLLVIHSGHGWIIIESTLNKTWCTTQITGSWMTTAIFMELLRLLDAFNGVLGRNVLLVGTPCCLFARFAISTAHNIGALRTEVTVWYHPWGLDEARWWEGCHFHILTHLWTISWPHVIF